MVVEFDSLSWIGHVVQGHQATLVTGQSVTLHGEEPAGRCYVTKADGSQGVNEEPIAYSRHFNVGDECIVGRFNLVYTGTIVSITSANVIVREHGETSTKRLSIAEFDNLNWRFDAAKVKEYNAEEMKCI